MKVEVKQKIFRKVLKTTKPKEKNNSQRIRK